MVTITICVGSSCYMRGTDDLAAALERLIEKEALQDQVELIGSFCMGDCSPGVSVQIGEHKYREVHCEEAETFFYQEVLPLLNGIK
jgi:NADH:ubiquinone oxidoreductase subunit E